MLRNQLRRAVRSGELIVGVLRRATHGPECWSWEMGGLQRPDDQDFIWRGDVDSEAEAFDALAACCSLVYWAGLAHVTPLHRAVR